MSVERVVMQRENEVSRVVREGRLTTGGDRCTLVIIHERSGCWVFYPHGDQKLGVRLSWEHAHDVAQAIMADVR